MSKSYRSILVRVLMCISFGSFFLYLFINKQNDVIELRRNIPILAKELKKIQEENSRLQYEIDRFESPVNLLEISRKPEFGHLKYPSTDSVIVIPVKEVKQ